MLDELMKALGPWPILQVILGLMAFGAGVWAVIRGLNSSKRDTGMALEDKRAEWAAYEQLKNISENSFKMVELQAKIVDGQAQMRDAINALITALWRQRPGD